MTQKQIRLITIGIIASGAVLTYGDKVQPIHGAPGWLTSAWPFFYMLAGIFKECASIFWPNIVAAVPQAKPIIDTTWGAAPKPQQTEPPKTS